MLFNRDDPWATPLTNNRPHSENNGGTGREGQHGDMTRAVEGGIHFSYLSITIDGEIASALNDDPLATCLCDLPQGPVRAFLGEEFGRHLYAPCILSTPRHLGFAQWGLGPPLRPGTMHGQHGLLLRRQAGLFVIGGAQHCAV